MYCDPINYRLSLCTLIMAGILSNIGPLAALAQVVKQPNPALLPQESQTLKKTDQAIPTKLKQSITPPQSEKPGDPEWAGEPVNLLDRKSLKGWDIIEFGGEGDSIVEDGLLSFDSGDPFTGISSTREDLPKTNYEVSLEARKMEGVDFFCGLTFPVEESHCTLIVGGWGGSTVGLSCIDEKDASSNDTCTYMRFEKEQWYKIRVRVEPETIGVWIDDKQVVSQDIKGKKISLRGDTELCKPMGICSFMTVAEFKNIQLRQFKPRTKPTSPAKAPPAQQSRAVDKK